MPSASPRLLPGAVSSRAALLRTWLTRSFTGRALLFGAGAKVLAAIVNAIAAGNRFAAAVDTLGDIALLIAAVLLTIGLFRDARRRLLWRVRRKLTLSYIFIGVVPALLIMCFVGISAVLVVLNVSSYIVRTRLANVIADARTVAEVAGVELEGMRTLADVQAALTRRQAAAARRYPAVSYALVPMARACGTGTAPWKTTVDLRAGSWHHTDPPRLIPEWVTCAGYAGLVVYAGREPSGETEAMGHLAARGVIPLSDAPGYAALVDVPLDDAIAETLRADAGVVVGRVRKVRGPSGTLYSVLPPLERSEPVSGFLQREWDWLGTENVVEWETGEMFQLTLPIRTSLAEVYRRVEPGQIGEYSIARGLFIAMAFIAALFLVILLVAFGMGLALARSITGSVHALFTGTERVRLGDFSHKISITSQDQLGELADSFNSMTSSIEDLLQEKAEKERLEQELRIARQIQMSLLPQGSLTVPGIALTALCEPAREVGGDYYDFLQIDEHRLGILIADVAGKGTSAALYMAELKGIVLSLSQQHLSPRRLLIEANRIISRHLDSRSFITVSYAVVDLEARTLTYARAGHCPLIYRPGIHSESRQPQVLTPEGMVLGLQIDDGRLFNQLLQEATINWGAGDLFLLYTDGITEAMNDAGECFGDQRLAQLVHDHGDLQSEELRERIVNEVRTFAGSASQQDDMTLVLLKMDGVAA